MLDGRVYLASLGMEQLLHDDIASQFSVKYIIFVSISKQRIQIIDDTKYHSLTRIVHSKTAELDITL